MDKLIRGLVFTTLGILMGYAFGGWTGLGIATLFFILINLIPD